MASCSTVDIFNGLKASVNTGLNSQKLNVDGMGWVGMGWMDLCYAHHSAVLIRGYDYDFLRQFQH